MRINEQIIKIIVPYKDIFTTVLIIKTEEGVVLFDTATYEEDVNNAILPALEQEGIAKEDIKYIFISHNHGDHAGGLPWLMEAIPHATIISNSPSLAEKYANYTVQTIADGEILAGCLQHISIPGHTPDAGGLLDLRTKTLMTGDALQVYGIYGSGNWGANVRWSSQHYPALERLKQVDAEVLVMAHDYHPCGQIVNGKDAILRCIDDCAEALNKIKDALLANPNADDETLAAQYNANSGLPKVAPKVFSGLRELI